MTGPIPDEVRAAVEVIAAEIMRVHGPLSTDEDSAEMDAEGIVAALCRRPNVLAALAASTPPPAVPDGDEIERRAELTHQALIAAGIDCKGGACIDVAVALAARTPQPPEHPNPPSDFPAAPWEARDSRVLDADGNELFVVRNVSRWHHDRAASWLVGVVNRVLGEPGPEAARTPQGEEKDR